LSLFVMSYIHEHTSPHIHRQIHTHAQGHASTRIGYWQVAP